MKVKTKATAAKGSATKAAPKPKASTNGTASKRRSAAEVAKLVPQFVKHLKAGGKMRELKAEHGFSSDVPIRTAMYNAGFDSKGNKHGEEADSINAGNATGRKQLVKLRGEGAGWYRLAFLSGLSEPDVKRVVEEAGGPTGRVYHASEKPAKAAPKKATTTAKKGTTRKATAANPSSRA